MDIIERLRKDADIADNNWPEVFCVETSLAREAADEIERLREALRNIAVSYYKDMPDGVDATIMWVGCTEIARSALQQKDSE